MSLVVVGGDGSSDARVARDGWVGERDGEGGTNSRRLAAAAAARDAFHATRARDARDARSTDDDVILVPCFQRAQAWT